MERYSREEVWRDGTFIVCSSRTLVLSHIEFARIHTALGNGFLSLVAYNITKKMRLVLSFYILVDVKET